MTPKHIYIAGPMRGIPAFNFPAFFEAERILRESYPNAEVKNPARMDAERGGEYTLHLLELDPTGEALGNYLLNHTDPASDIRLAMKEDLAYVAGTADLVALLPGWRKSKGAGAEAAAALSVGCDVAEFEQAHVNPAAPYRPDYLAPATTDPAVQGWEEAVKGSEAARNGVSSPSQPSDGAEVRVVAASGGEKGAKAATFDQIPPDTLWRLAEHFGKGARKYSAHNFRRGYDWSLSYNALLRHLLDFWAGRDWDVCPKDGRGCKHIEGEVYPETEHGSTCFNHTGSHHLDAVMWHGHTLRVFYDEHKEYDDRYVSANNG